MADGRSNSGYVGVLSDINSLCVITNMHLTRNKEGTASPAPDNSTNLLVSVIASQATRERNGGLIVQKSH